MRLNCEIEISDRNLPSLCSRPKQKPTRASLIIGFPPGTPKKAENVHLLLCTARNQLGVKYKVHGNTVKVFQRYADEGKATIRLDVPPHDLLIRKADPLELKSFLKMMQRSIMTTTSLEHSSLPRLTVSTRIRSQKTKIEIVDRQSYSKMSAFPSTLRVLTIHNCQLKRIDSRIITLPRLNVLHLSNNAIVDIPVKIGVMCINELNLSNNSITLIPQGIFVDSNLCLTLQTLNLSHNALSSIPATVGNLVLLHTFNLSGNKLTQLPDSLGDLQRLKFLTLDNNFLDSLPGRIIKLKLDYIDISRNPFQCSDTYITDLDSCPTLLEWAARSFLKSGVRVPDDELPVPVRNYLSMAKKCLCNRPFVISHVRYASPINLKIVSQNVVYSSNSQVLVSGMACRQVCVAHIRN